MRVSRLEIFGFKSFVERFILNFDKNFIGVVGPNGCGKSNIVDALRWVLGETHAKQLRGGLLEDLIFNGSDSRRPLGMAEVSITVRPHDGWAPATVHRLQELARSDDGRIENQSTVSDAGEEDVNLIIESEPGDNSRSNTASTLLQLPGLFDATEIQLTRRLYRSGESEYFLNRLPCRLRDMVEFYRLIGLGSRGLSIVQQGQVGSLVSAKPEELRVLIEEAAGVSGFRSRINAAERRVEKTIENISRLRDIIIEVEKQVRVLQKQAKRASERGQLKEELVAREVEYFRLRGSLIVKRDEELAEKEGELEESLAQYRVKIEDLNIEISHKEANVTELDESLKGERQRRDALSSTIREKRKREQQLQQNLAKLESLARSNQFQLSDLESRSNTLEITCKNLQSDLNHAEKSFNELDEERTKIQSLLEETLNRSQEGGPELVTLKEKILSLRERLGGEEQIKAELKSLEGEISDLALNERELEREYARKRGESHSAEAQISSLKKQLQELTKSVTSNISTDKTELGQVVLSGIRIPVGLEKAVAAVLGERARYLISTDPESLLLNFKVDTNQKAVGVVREATDMDVPSENDGLLINKLQFEEWVRPTARKMLAGVYLVEDIGEAIKLLPELNLEKDSLVTKDGIVLGSWGWSITGERELHSFRLARLLEEEEIKLRTSNSELEILTSQQVERRKEMEILHSRRDIKRSELITFERIKSEISINLQRERELEKKQFEEKVTEERRVQALLRDASSKCSAAKSRFDYLIKNLSLHDQEQKEIFNRQSELQTEWLELETEFKQVKLTLDGEISAEAFSKIDSLNSLLEVGALNIEFSSQSELEGELLQLETALYDKESVIRNLRAEIRAVTESKNSIQEGFDTKLNHLQSIKLQTERGKVELDLLRAETVQKFGESFELSIQGLFKSYDISDLEKEVSKSFLKVEQLRTRLTNDGEIDPAVVDQYTVEKERLLLLEEQLKDLEGAHKLLERSIKHLRELSRQKFIETFEDVSRRFGELIPKLFGGGFGEMTLSLPEDPLNTGVSIIVRPPGKKLRSLELLSGGEKALTAAAVLLAMFLHRPSPICVLDEVDAPLDDANLERFLSLIKEISEKTQLLMITHNKQSMIASDRLIGITMQEPGVSKALSVSFEEAEQELERVAANA